MTPQNHETIVLYGCHELDYPRNRTIRAALEQAGYSVTVCHSRAPYPLRHWQLLRQFWPLRKSTRWAWVTEGGYRILPILRLFLFLIRSPVRIVYDPFISRYDTYVIDRKRYKPNSLQARIMKWHDWSATRLAHALVFDTSHHRDFFYARYDLHQPSLIVPIMIPEQVFAPRPPADSAAPGVEVLFYGTFIPLQGVDTVVRAASLLRHRPDIHFTLIGDGQTKAATQELYQSLPAGHLAWLPPVAEFELPAYIARADICLGIFGNTEKAARVVPNKVSQTAAMGKAIVTRDSLALRDYFTPDLSIVLCPAHDPRALADCLERLADSPVLRSSLGSAARDVFEKSFSIQANACRLRDWLGGLHGQ